MRSTNPVTCQIELVNGEVLKDCAPPTTQPRDQISECQVELIHGTIIKDCVPPPNTAVLLPDCEVELINGTIIKDCDGQVTTVTTTTAATQPVTGELPATGADSLTLAVLALGFVLVGASYLVTGVRRG